MVSDDPGPGEREEQSSHASWWSRAIAPPATPVADGDGEPPRSAHPRWRWELPADSIGRARRWGALRTPVPVVFGLVVVTALLAGAVGAAIGITSQRHHDSGAGPVVFAASGPAQQQSVSRGPTSVAGIAARILPSVVEVDVSAGAAKDTGSGFVIATSGTTAYILTNNHVISLAATQHGSVRVVLQNGASLAAHIRGRATTSDLAVLIVNRVKGLRPLVLGDSKAIAVGDPVIAVGSPLGFAGTVTSGIVSAINRPVAANGEGTDTNAVIDAIQTDAAINPGNSGGPLVDMAGQVIGVTSAIATLSGGANNPFGAQDQSGNIGLGFAIPTASARKTATQIIRQGYAVRPIMGVTLDPFYDGSPAGGLIACPANAAHCQAVTPGSAAAKAGLRAGDIIVSIDGQATLSSDEVVIFTRQHDPGEVVHVDVVRDGAHKSFTVTLGEARA